MILVCKLFERGVLNDEMCAETNVFETNMKQYDDALVCGRKTIYRLTKKIPAKIMGKFSYKIDINVTFTFKSEKNDIYCIHGRTIVELYR